MTVSNPQTEDYVPHSSPFTWLPALGSEREALLLTLPGSAPQPCLLPAGP